MQPIIRLENVSKDYFQAGETHNVLNDITLMIEESEFIAIVGASGNGKSTLLNLLTGVDHPSHGRVIVGGMDLKQLSGTKLTNWRGKHVGIIFQSFQLLPSLNLLQNVILPMDFIAQISKKQRQQRAFELLEQVGLADKAKRLPNQISGGEQQRTAIARAMANDPAIIVADEPTGNLDSDTADKVFQIFKNLNKQGKTLLMVTHNDALADAATRKFTIHAGHLHESDTIHQKITL